MAPERRKMALWSLGGRRMHWPTPEGPGAGRAVAPGLFWFSQDYQRILCVWPACDEQFLVLIYLFIPSVG